ncbi:MAG: T9SS type A sorting domain-containing protein [Ignavibacteriaceae bacterium]
MKFRLLLTVIFGILFICVTQTKAQWVKTNDPYGDFTQCFAVSGTNLFAGSNGYGVSLSKDNGTSWTAVDSGLTSNFVTALAVSGTNLFAGTMGNGIFLSTDNGASWSVFDSTLIFNYFSPYIHSIAVIGNNLLVATRSDIFLVPSDRTSLSAISSGLIGYQVMSLAVSGTNFYAGTDFGVSLSTDSGTSWIQVDSGLSTNTGTDYVYALAIYPNGAGGTNFFAAQGIHGLFLSTNNGTSWTSADSGLTSIDIFSFAVNGTNLFVGTSGSGVSLSTNNGASWTSDSTGLSNNWGYSDANALIVSGTNLFAGNDRGVWRRPLAEMITGVKEEQNNLPSNFALEQNYPNPFNPTTTINYSVSKTSMVTIKVYDILGNEVASLMNEEKPAGRYSVNFTASKLASGVYFYRMQAGSFVETKKLILLK